MKITGILTLLLAISFSLHAQERRVQKQSISEKSETGTREKHDKGRHLQQKLDLTDAQKTQIKANKAEYRKKLSELESDEQISLKNYKEKKALLQKEQKEKMQQVLTVQQKKQVTLMKAEREKKHDEDVEKKMEELKTKLSLTDEQVNGLKAIQKKSRSSIKQIRENESLSAEEKKDKIQSIKKEAKQGLSLLLTEEQLKKMEQTKKERREK